jgi:hypothetical protein
MGNNWWHKLQQAALYDEPAVYGSKLTGATPLKICTSLEWASAVLFLNAIWSVYSGVSKHF